MSAEFKVIKVDPDGSGMDWHGHLGSTIYNAKRCCDNCTVIFGAFEGHPFDPTQPESSSNDPRPVGLLYNELVPLNQEAKEIFAEIEAEHPWVLGLVSEEKPSLWLRAKRFVLSLVGM